MAVAYAQPTSPVQAAPRERILFVGNSYTYVNNLPAVLEQLANNVQPGSLEAKMIVVGGARVVKILERAETMGDVPTRRTALGKCYAANLERVTLCYFRLGMLFPG